MPEAAITGSLVSVESLPDLIGGSPILCFLCLFIDNHHEISGIHTVKAGKLYLGSFAFLIGVKEIALTINMGINPVLDVLEISLISGSSPNQVTPVEVQRFRIAPRAEVLCGGKPFHR